jgi:hypothetical protein
MPARRLELHNGAPTRWAGSILQQYLPGQPKGFFEGAVVTPDTVYRTGRTVRQDWNNAVAGPDLATGGTGSSVERTGNSLAMYVASYAPGETGHSGNPFYDIFFVKGSAVLSRDGAVVGRGSNPNAAGFTLPADTGRYTLAVQATRAKNWATLATRVDTTWTFTSGPTAQRALLALPSVKVSGDFDAQGRARAGRPFTLDLVAGSQAEAPASKVISVSVEVSGDDGQTWRPARVRAGGGGRWCAEVTNPPAGYVSLRVKASNAAGATVEQTVLRAYALTS